MGKTAREMLAAIHADRKKPEPAPKPQPQREHHGGDILRRVPPQNIDAEESLIGAVFIDGEAYFRVSKIVQERDFYREAHRLIWRAIGAVLKSGRPVDEVLMSAELQSSGVLELIGGPAYIVKMATRVPSAANAEHYAALVKDAAGKRNLASVFTELAAEAYNGLSLPALIGEAERQLEPMLKGGAVAEDRRAMDAFEAHQAMVSDQRGYAVEGLIKEGCTMILSGLMGAGKSTFAMNLVRAWYLGEEFLGRAVKQSKTLVVVSPKEYEAWAETIGFWKIKGGVFLVESTKAHFRNPIDQVKWFEEEMDRLGCRAFVLDTLFDFYGTPVNNSGDQNRIVMNEQAPFLELVRERMFYGLVLGHPPKSEAQAFAPRDPEESFGGHTAWTAQHRMRGTIRRNSNASAFITGKGGYGDKGVLSEHMLLFDDQSRIVSLGGPFKDYLGVVALPTLVEAISGWMSRSDIEKRVNKRKEWILAGLKEGLKSGALKTNGKKGRGVKYALADEPEQDELFG